MKNKAKNIHKNTQKSEADSPNTSDKKKRRLWDNLLYVYKHMIKWLPESMVLILMNTLAVAIAPFIWVTVPKLLIDELQGQARIPHIFTILGVTLVVASIVFLSKKRGLASIV